MARSQRSVPAALVVVALAGLLAAGHWLQPRLDGRTKAPATVPAGPTTPVPTSPGPTSPTLATDRPAGASPISRVVATSSPVDAIAVTRQAVWLAVGGLVLRVDPATGRSLVVPEVEDGAPVVDLAAGAGAGGSPASTRPAAGSSPPSASPPARWLSGPARTPCGSVAPGAGCGGSTRDAGPRTAGRPMGVTSR